MPKTEEITEKCNIWLKSLKDSMKELKRIEKMSGRTLVTLADSILDAKNDKEALSILSKNDDITEKMYGLDQIIKSVIKFCPKGLLFPEKK